MLLRTIVRDCLYLNWALPAAALPPPPPPLRYERHAWRGGDWVFASALLFHQEGIHVGGIPGLHLSYPQLNLRLYVLDGASVPSVLFRRMLMPAWMVPGVRLVSHQPAARARLDFPRPSREQGNGRWRWSVKCGESLEVEAWPGSPAVGEGPRLGPWERAVDYFRNRQRGYADGRGGLRRMQTRKAAELPAVWPMRAEVLADGLLSTLLPLAGADGWPPLHSAWLCPEIPFELELGLVPKVALPPTVPHPAASRRSAACL
ncbi:MAG TPA: DUF2071 domain-containing protein [Thermoanaerobaculia bacterium]|nr:DUF2071 domain-containing protein [Thermoanaerobaculia bacterium]